jgi:hypothetical protein
MRDEQNRGVVEPHLKKMVGERPSGRQQLPRLLEQASQLLNEGHYVAAREVVRSEVMFLCLRGDRLE